MEKTLVIIPALNEERHLPKLFSRLPKKYDVLVIDDGSTDRTGEIARKSEAKVIRHAKNQGVGASLRDGFNYAIKNKYSACVVVNADLQHPPELVDGFVKELDGLDAVIGSRFLGKDGRQMPFLRRAGNQFFTLLVNAVYGTKYTDVTCGMRAFKTAALPKIMSGENRYGVEIDMSIKLRRFKTKEKAIPVIYAPNTSKMNLFRTWFQLMRPVLKNLAGG